MSGVDLDQVRQKVETLTLELDTVGKLLENVQENVPVQAVRDVGSVIQQISEDLKKVTETLCDEVTK